MQGQEFEELLTEIKCFLAKNSQLEGAFNLLARLDCYLETKLKKQTSATEDEIQIILDSEDQLSTTVQPRKFASILDIFILQYNFESKAYQILPLSPTAKSQQTQGNRNAIYELILSPLKQHINQKQKTNSMTDLHKLTANVPKTHPPLILPNYSEQPFKYIYIYESKQCMEYDDKYYLADRYYCFVVDGLASACIDLLYKDMRNRIFQERIMKVNDSIQVNCKFVYQCLLSTMPLLVDRANELPISLSQPVQHAWIQQEKWYDFAQLKTSIVSSLVLLITYFALSQFKVIFITSKDEKHKLSEIVLSMQGALEPLKYVYPVVFCTLSGNHCDFVESPVPLTIGFWGSDRRRVKFQQQLRQYLTGELKGIPTILIDLEKNTIRCSSGTKKQDLYVIQKMNRFIHKYSKGSCMYKKISSFFADVLKDIKNSKNQKSEWLSLFHSKVKNSQMYQHYDKK